MTKYTLSSDQKQVEAVSTLSNGNVLSNKTYAYDIFGNMIKESVEKTAGDWSTTRYEYGSEYQGAYLTAVIAEAVQDADGSAKNLKTAYTYDFNTGNRLTETDGNGNITTYAYDLLDRLIKERLADQSARSYQYDDLNNILQVTNANGNTLAYYYDGLGKLSKVQEAGKKANLVQLQYDDSENLITETDGNQNTKQLSYDQQTRITRVSHRDKAGNVLAETRVGYDEANLDRFGNPLFKVTVTQKGDAQNRVTNYYFDQFERLSKQGRFNEGQEEFSAFQYDYLGNQTKAVNFAGEKGIFTYDALGRMLSTTDAAGNVTTNRYDRLGNLICQKDPLGHAMYFTYDQLGRKINEKAPFETNSYSESKYYYDGAGNLVKIVDPEGYATKYHFNERNQLSSVEQVISADQSDITQVEYDKEGNTVKIKKGLNAWIDTDFVTNAYRYDIH